MRLVSNLFTFSFCRRAASPTSFQIGSVGGNTVVASMEGGNPSFYLAQSNGKPLQGLPPLGRNISEFQCHAHRIEKLLQCRDLWEENSLRLKPTTIFLSLNENGTINELWTEGDSHKRADVTLTVMDTAKPIERTANGFIGEKGTLLKSIEHGDIVPSGKNVSVKISVRSNSSPRIFSSESSSFRPSFSSTVSYLNFLLAEKNNFEFNPSKASLELTSTETGRPINLEEGSQCLIELPHSNADLFKTHFPQKPIHSRSTGHDYLLLDTIPC